MKSEPEKVVVLGASANPERYSNMAVRMLLENGYAVIPVHPVAAEIEGLPVVHELSSIEDYIHTLTLYLGPQRSEKAIDAIIALGPARVILNPGTESPVIEQSLAAANIPVVRACTLVLLRTGQF